MYVTSNDKYLYAIGGGYPTCLAGTGIPPSLSSLSNTSGTCVGCSIGYSAVRSLCTYCAKGQFGNRTNAVRCYNCLPGTYSAVRMSSVCTPSPAGSYVQSFGSSVSTPCKNGTYSPFSGAIVCTQCTLVQRHVRTVVQVSTLRAIKQNALFVRKDFFPKKGRVYVRLVRLERTRQ